LEEWAVGRRLQEEEENLGEEDGRGMNLSQQQMPTLK
jgi:hypothetical protein